METMILDSYENRKIRLLSILNKTKDYFAKAQNEDKVKAFESLINNVQNGEFVIVIVGEFSAGKSTFLNALMGEKYLPSFTSETTATINYLKHIGKSPNGRELEVVYKDKTRGIEYGEATQQDIEKFVSTSSTTDVVNEVEYVNLFINSPYLEKGVMLVDSPGLNGVAEGHREVTENQIEKSHACIFMFNATQPGKKSDFEVLSKLMKKFNTIILVLNQIDKIKRDEETVEDVVERLKYDYSKQFEGAPIPEIWPIAAYPALVANSSQKLEYPDNSGKREHSEEDRARFLEVSRIEPFKNRLWKFLTQGEKAKQEMLAPIEKVRHALVERRGDLENIIANLQTLVDVKEIEGQMEGLQRDIVRLEEEIQKNTQTIEGVLQEKLTETINQLKAGAQTIQQRYARRIDNWTELDDVEFEFEDIQRKASRDFDDVLERAYEYFMTEFEDTMRMQYLSYMELVQNKLQEHSSLLEKIATPKPEEFVFDAAQFHVGLEKFEAQRREVEAEIEKINEKLDKVEKDFIKAELIQSDKQDLENRLEALKEKELLYIQTLGPKPFVYYDEVSEEKRSRGGVLGSLGDFLFGKKSNVKTKRIMDESIVKNYEEERENYRQMIKESESAIYHKIEALQQNEGLTPEMLDYERKQIERQKENLRQKREEYEQQFKEEFQKKNRRALLKVKHQMGDYISELTKQGEDVFKTSLVKKRKDLTEIIINVVDSKIRNQIVDKENELQEMFRILQSTAVEKELKITQYEEEKQEVTELLSEMIELLTEIHSIAIDSIETSNLSTLSD